MISSQISVYKFDDQTPVRAFADENGTPWFCGKDVAAALGYKRERDAIRQHCKGAVIHRPLQTEGGTQDFVFITEGDMYRLIAGSKLPSAQRFESWIFDDVIPSIRRTGGYLAGQERMTPEQMALAGMRWLQERVAEQEKQIEEQKPYATFGRALSVADRDILVGDLAKILRQNGYQTGQNRLFKQWMGEHVIFRKNVSAHHYEYRPTQASLEAGWFKLVGHVYISSDGKHESLTLMVTPRGQRHFLTKYLKDMPALSINAQEAE